MAGADIHTREPGTKAGTGSAQDPTGLPTVAPYALPESVALPVPDQVHSAARQDSWVDLITKKSWNSTILKGHKSTLTLL